MATEIKVPTLGESISEATVTTWLKQVGDAVAADEPLLELETDKVTMEVNAPAAGTLTARAGRRQLPRPKRLSRRLLLHQAAVVAAVKRSRLPCPNWVNPLPRPRSPT